MGKGKNRGKSAVKKGGGYRLLSALDLAPGGSMTA